MEANFPFFDRLLTFLGSGEPGSLLIWAMIVYGLWTVIFEGDPRDRSGHIGLLGRDDNDAGDGDGGGD